MPKPAKVKVRVSTQPVVVMEAEVARKIRQHARTSMKAEVCGVLIGNTDHERMTVEACIAGINAAQGGAHVTFTQDTWEHIYKIKDKEYPDHKIVGWYHSHPGFGVFLSEHDLFIQQNFFSNPQQVAWVYDPHTDEEGCFGWIGGNIEKLSAIRVGYSRQVEITSTAAHEFQEDDDGALGSMVRTGRDQGPPQPAWMKWAIRALGYFSSVLFGFLICFLFLNWRWEPVFEQAERYQQLMDALRQFDEQHPGVLGLRSGGPPNALDQPTSQQKVPAEKNSEKGNNGKH
ncbi:MAG: Mov34/MPN/PAD-1 family protein [Candidatus Angelobacter sp.]